MRPRILRVITRLNVGGPATHVQLADAGLRDRGWDTLLAFGVIADDEAEAPLRHDIRAVRVRGLQRRPAPRAEAQALSHLIRIIRSHRPHIIHTHLSKAGLLGRVAGLMASRAMRVHTFHGNVFDGYFGAATARAILGVERSLGKRTHAVIALSEAQRQELLDRRIAAERRIQIVPLGIDLARFRDIDRLTARRVLSIPEGEPVVVAVGRMVPIKRLDRLLRAFSTVTRALPDAQLYLVGGGSERAGLEALTRETGLAGNVTFVGWSSDTHRWYGAADIVALSSDREGTPLALIEAAAAGRPVVATAVGGVPDVVRDGVTGRLVSREDELGMANAMIELLSDEAVARRMGSAALDAADRFGADRLVDDLDALYRSLLAER